MSKKESNPIRNGAIASVIGGIILSFWTPFRDLLVKVAFWCFGLLISIWEWLTSSHEVYGWVIVLLVFLSVPTLIEVVSLVVRKKKPGVEELYKSDHLFGADWHWYYSNGLIKNLWCLCSSCKSELVYSELVPNRYNFTHDGLEPKTIFSCERCNTMRCSLRGDKRHALGTVEREICRKIRNHEWKNIQNG
ncbi:hypothetical protein C9J12_21380 [Photobacterium frigidiphilum]|uniref:Uncharacterized protein n=1 Tax=Photobacterium frigidiphilum TaxID=264736 RepID=A0A2T3JAH7_9GAMM|nr:hypothetical protein [Photobacterium frigidiphilum]PSU45794.1 hypothetical protein C9J12_21380 [Photobacterium frigidiphilum]